MASPSRAASQVDDGRDALAGGEPALLEVEEVQLAIDRQRAVLAEDDRAVVEGVARALVEAGDDVAAVLRGESGEVCQEGALVDLLGRRPCLVGVGEAIAGVRQLGEHDQVGLPGLREERVEGRSRRRGVTEYRRELDQGDPSCQRPGWRQP